MLESIILEKVEYSENTVERSELPSARARNERPHVPKILLYLSLTTYITKAVLKIIYSKSMFFVSALSFVFPFVQCFPVHSKTQAV